MAIVSSPFRLISWRLYHLRLGIFNVLRVRWILFYNLTSNRTLWQRTDVSLHNLKDDSQTGFCSWNATLFKQCFIEFKYSITLFLAYPRVKWYNLESILCTYDQLCNEREGVDEYCARLSNEQQVKCACSYTRTRAIERSIPVGLDVKLCAILSRFPHDSTQHFGLKFYTVCRI